MVLFCYTIWYDKIEVIFMCATVMKIGISTGVILPKVVAERLTIK
ncbi:hypothetical protein [Prosthecochloris sp.]|nr:hypothetical protein [Prosthecochloris sp.]